MCLTCFYYFTFGTYIYFVIFLLYYIAGTRAKYDVHGNEIELLWMLSMYFLGFLA